MRIIRKVHYLAQASLRGQRRDIDSRQTSMASFIRAMLAITLLLGTVVAWVSVHRIRNLELRSKEQMTRAETAEAELRRLSRQLVQAHEDERKSISRELHDEVGQTLTALRLELKSVQGLRTASEAEFNEHAEAAKRLAEQSVRALKDMATGLRPAMLDELGLGSALQWQARRFSKHTGIAVNVQLEGLNSPVPERHRTCVYRIVQEALTNAARHADAKEIEISVVHENGTLSVSVRDNGRGFDPGTVRGVGLGIVGMQERVKELGGEMTLNSRLNHGTALSATIPVREEVDRYAGANSAG